ncbi:MAG TPA: tagaturonate epimerase family protein, partial [Phycisphaerae bacterium]|nr:tagaturonate epimerase family protein [Phycisphaerae bacterium]
MIEKIKKAIALDVYAPSVSRVGDVIYFLARRGREKFVGSLGHGEIAGEPTGEVGGVPVLIGPTDHGNARAIRGALPWTAPKCLALATSVGLGDRLGLATPGHVRAVRGTGLAAV